MDLKDLRPLVLGCYNNSVSAVSIEAPDEIDSLY